MKNVWTIYRREISAYFNSPIAYIFICLFVLVMAVIFFAAFRFFSTSSPDIRTYFTIFPWAFTIFIPAVTMRLWAEEKRMGTMEVLMTLPLQAWEVVLGKFLAGYTIIALSLLFTVGVPATLSFVMPLDWGSVVASYVGALAIAGVYIAVGAWVSTFTRDQVIALLIAFAISFVALLIGIPPVINFLNNILPNLGIGNFIGWFGTLFHYEDFTKGLINPVGLIYAVGFTAFFLVLNNVFVEGRKF